MLSVLFLLSTPQIVRAKKLESERAALETEKQDLLKVEADQRATIDKLKQTNSWLVTSARDRIQQISDK
jgi:hypothetical protein